MKLDLHDAWSVRIDIQDGARAFQRHLNVHVLAPTIERALELTRAAYPDSKVWAINHATGRDSVVIIDERAGKL